MHYKFLASIFCFSSDFGCLDKLILHAEEDSSSMALAKYQFTCCRRVIVHLESEEFVVIHATQSSGFSVQALASRPVIDKTFKLASLNLFRE